MDACKYPVGLTSTGDDSANPGAVVVEFLHTAIYICAVGGPILLPVATCSAPPRPAVGVTDEDVLAVKKLETGAVDIGIRPVALVSVSLEVVATVTSALSPGFPSLLPVQPLFFSALCRQGP